MKVEKKPIISIIFYSLIIMLIVLTCYNFDMVINENLNVERFKSYSGALEYYKFNDKDVINSLNDEQASIKSDIQTKYDVSDDYPIYALNNRINSDKERLLQVYNNAGLLAISLVIGLVSGTILYYILNKENKKIKDYLVIYVLGYFALTVFEYLVMCVSFLPIYGSDVWGSFTFSRYLDQLLPYTIIYALVCLINYFWAKNKVNKMNAMM